MSNPTLMFSKQKLIPANQEQKGANLMLHKFEADKSHLC